MGIYQGKPFNVFINSKDVKKSLENHSIPFEQGESINDLNKRYIYFMLNIAKNTNYTNIAIISHSAAISNLKSFLNSEKYESLRMCKINVNNNNLIVENYLTINDSLKKINIGIKNENKK